MRDVFFLLPFRHRWKVSLFFVVSVGAAWAWTALGPKDFRSESKLFVRLGRENVALDPTVTFGQAPAVAIPQTRDNEINSVTEMLRSRVLLEQVVDDLGAEAILDPEDHSLGATGPSGAAEPLADESDAIAKQGTLRQWGSRLGLLTPLTGRQRAIERLRKMVWIEAARKSDVITVACDSPRPELSQAIVSKLVEAYLDHHVRLNRTPGARDFFAEQTERLGRDLGRSEEAMRDLKNSTGVSSLATHRLHLMDRIARLEDERLQSASELAAAEAEVRLLKETLASTSRTQVHEETSGLANDAADRMRDQLYALEVKQQELHAKYTDAHPEVRHVRDQIEAARAILEMEEQTRTHVKTGPSRAYEAVQLALLTREPSLVSLRAKADALVGQLAAERARLEGLNDHELELAKLERTIDLEDANYRKYAENLEQANIDQALELGRISNINIVQPATFEAKPVSPRPLVNMALGIAVGLFGGLALAIASDRADHSFRTPDCIEHRLDLPVLASIPRMKPKQFVTNGKR
ncbi:MAG TPA: GNVR domain-containing protein [Pirellulales bacterium]|nr:GNVR domain-containing protein [Pirellulales bacterium]